MLSNGDIKAPCHLFSMGADIYATTVLFRRVSIRMGLLTGTVMCLVFYIYLRRLLSYERLIHSAELFRHNWCVETEEKEKRLKIDVKNRLFDTSIDGNIDEKGAALPKSHNTTNSDGDPGSEQEYLGLLPRDKLAAFHNPIRMRIWLYVLLICTSLIVWLILLVEMTSYATGFNTRFMFSHDSFAFSWMYEVLGAHRTLMDVEDERHKCIGKMSELKSGLSSGVMTIIKIFVYERSLSPNIVSTCIPILSMAILFDLGVQGLFFCRLNHRGETQNGKRYVYFYSVGKTFFITFFVFSMFLLFASLTEQYVYNADRHRD